MNTTSVEIASVQNGLFNYGNTFITPLKDLSVCIGGNYGTDINFYSCGNFITKYTFTNFSEAHKVYLHVHDVITNGLKEHDSSKKHLDTINIQTNR